MNEVALLILSYLIGSINPAYILCWLLKGKDIRRLGTRNAGATNAYYVLGDGYGIFVAIFDAAKGILAMALALYNSFNVWWVYGAAAAAVIGHVFPFYLGFKGGLGKSTATAAVVFGIIYYTPHPAILIALLYIFYDNVLSKYVMTAVRKWRSR